MSHAVRATVVGSFAAAVMAVFASVSCASAPDKNRVTTVIEPDFSTYKTFVDPYLARRCGTLDCHGQPGRGYRIYGREGLRISSVDAGLVSGQQPTTDAEVRANFDAIISLEPEEFNRVMGAQGADDALLKWIWIRKPLRLERHKGGPAMAEDDFGYKCVVGWLRIPVVTGDGTPIPVGQRAQLSDVGQAFCIQAGGFP